jgi:hypothetical protein
MAKSHDKTATKNIILQQYSIMFTFGEIVKKTKKYCKTSLK